MPDELQILTREHNGNREIAVCSGNRLLEYYQEGLQEDSYVNAVLLGRVDRVLPAMKAAFVRIGLPTNGFLPIHEQESYDRQAQPLRTDDEIIVQVKKDAKDEKGAFLSRDIALVGQTLIFMPCNRHVGVSKRVTEQAQREMLTELGSELTQGAFGVIMREAALYARRDEILEELEELQQRWQKIQDKAHCAKPPAVLEREPSVLTGLVRDYGKRYSVQLICSDAVNHMPGASTGVLWQQVPPLEMDARWSSLRLEAQLTAALGCRVELQNGGWLMIDEREALTTIDVNSGRYVGEKGDRELALHQNLAACEEIARQLRLRNLSGIVIVDFIDMPDDEQRGQVQQALQQAMSLERVKCTIHGFTRLGLLEMTRKRTRESLRGVLCTACQACGGVGYRRNQK